MLKRKVIHAITTILLASALVWSLGSCASAPPPVVPASPVVEPTPAVEPPPAPVVTTPVPTPEPVPVPPQPQTLAETEYDAAQKAIDEAVAAGAETYAADLLAEARNAFDQARKKASDPDAARLLLKVAEEKAREAKEAALAAKAKELREFLAKLDKEAVTAIEAAEAAKAATYSPDLLGEAKNALTQARDQVASDAKAAEASYRRAAEKAEAARKAALEAQARELQALLVKLDQQAQEAIAQAEAVEADTYSPDLLNQARKDLAQGRDRATSAPQAAQVLLESAIEKAKAARDAAQVARTRALVDKLDQAISRYVALQPEKWDIQGTKVLTQAEAAKVAVVSDYVTGRPLATEALENLEAAIVKLGNRLIAVQDLRVKAQKALEAAEAVDAYVWVPDLVQSANDAFFQGTGAWKKFRLDAAEEAWNTALFEANSATAKSQLQFERKRTEKLMLETMKKLEDASGKTVVDPQDNIIPPQAWDGKKELEKLQKKPLSLRIPSDGSVVVLGDKQRVTYLDEAKDQWMQGVKALAADDLPLANEAFLQSQKLIEIYLSMAVDKVYTVRLMPDRRDSLWRIAEYDGIYATPWEWPKIWKRNQKLIQNPDLIYPGWQLIIPPQ